MKVIARSTRTERRDKLYSQDDYEDAMTSAAIAAWYERAMKKGGMQTKIFEQDVLHDLECLHVISDEDRNTGG